MLYTYIPRYTRANIYTQRYVLSYHIIKNMQRSPSRAQAFVQVVNPENMSTQYRYNYPWRKKHVIKKKTANIQNLTRWCGKHKKDYEHICGPKNGRLNTLIFISFVHECRTTHNQQDTPPSHTKRGLYIEQELQK